MTCESCGMHNDTNKCNVCGHITKNRIPLNIRISSIIERIKISSLKSRKLSLEVESKYKFIKKLFNIYLFIIFLIYILPTVIFVLFNYL